MDADEVAALDRILTRLACSEDDQLEKVGYDLYKPSESMISVHAPRSQ